MLARDWRAGELRVLAAALVIAVASDHQRGVLRRPRRRRRLARDAHQLLGADLVLVSDHPWQREIADEIERARRCSAPRRSTSSAWRPAKESQLAGVKAVTENYPLRGRLRIAPAPGAPDAPAERGPARAARCGSRSGW